MVSPWSLRWRLRRPCPQTTTWDHCRRTTPRRALGHPCLTLAARGSPVPRRLDGPPGPRVAPIDVSSPGCVGCRHPWTAPHRRVRRTRATALGLVRVAPHPRAEWGARPLSHHSTCASLAWPCLTLYRRYLHVFPSPATPPPPPPRHPCLHPPHAVPTAGPVKREMWMTVRARPSPPCLRLHTHALMPDAEVRTHALPPLPSHLLPFRQEPPKNHTALGFASSTTSRQFSKWVRVQTRCCGRWAGTRVYPR
jgi:hypothetical protein